MSRDIPSLNTIRFFESAARNLSFTRAGEELFVTQGAVSKQIKLLEEQLDCKLFVRSGPNLRLTSHGESFQQTVSDALEIIQRGVGNLRRNTISTIKVSTLPSFTNNWLLPRLPHLENDEPGLLIDIASSFAVIDFSVRTDIDVAIRLGRGHWPGLYSRQLTRDRLFPVCSPNLAENIQSVEDLLDHNLLIDQVPFDEWASWFEKVKLPYETDNKRFYDDTGSQLRAAVLGQGICLGREELVQEQLESGELVRLFDVDFESEIHYYFVCPEERINDRQVKRFHDWLIKMIEVPITTKSE